MFLLQKKDYGTYIDYDIMVEYDYICQHCGKQYVAKRVNQRFCKDCIPNNNKWFRDNMRKEAFEHYGSRCLFCGENEKKFLCFDHINNDGKFHRKEVGGGSIGILWDLKKRHWPNDVVQVLCHNCNFIKQSRKRDITYEPSIIQKIMLHVFEKYGNKCICCGNNNLNVLQLDHVMGGGNKDRKITSSAGLYRKLDRIPPQKEYRLLCANCNSAVGFYGKCPHGEPKYTTPIEFIDEYKTVCKYCGKVCSKYRKNCSFCSTLCAVKYKYDKERKELGSTICDICGKTFNKKREISHICSNKCRNKLRYTKP